MIQIFGHLIGLLSWFWTDWQQADKLQNNSKQEITKRKSVILTPESLQSHSKDYTPEIVKHIWTCMQTACFVNLYWSLQSTVGVTPYQRLHGPFPNVTSVYYQEATLWISYPSQKGSLLQHHTALVSTLDLCSVTLYCLELHLIWMLSSQSCR